MTRLNYIDRRRWLQSAGMGLCGLSMSAWLPAFANQVVEDPRRTRHCILLWMGGGPSQTDTFDMKPNHENGGEFKEVATNVPGIRFSEHLPKLGKLADQLAIIRSLSTREGDHERGTHLMRTGHSPMGTTRFPSVAAALAKELASEDASLPPYVSVAPFQGFANSGAGSGFLGPKYSPLKVGRSGSASIGGGGTPQEGFAEFRVDALSPPDGITTGRMDKRLELWRTLEDGFLRHHPAAATKAHEMVYANTLRMMEGDSAAAFDLSQEPEPLREAYGRGTFGQGCLLARRLVERGVPLVEVTLSSTAGAPAGWDTHDNNFDSVQALSAELDAGWSTLITDLRDRGLLERTTIVWMGEFGRTPQIASRGGTSGRDHFPQAWSCVLSGGGIAGGQVHGRTSEDGMHVEEDKTSVTQVLATVCAALGVSPDTQNMSGAGRPIYIVEDEPIEKLLA